MTEKQEYNRPTVEGRQLGEELARLTEKAAEELSLNLQAENALHLMPKPCESCAFKRGTFPNGCPETVLDAIKCTMEGIPFHCHMKPGGMCRGYFIARSGLHGQVPIETPWQLSHEMKDAIDLHEATNQAEEPVCVTINPVEIDRSSFKPKWYVRFWQALRRKLGAY